MHRDTGSDVAWVIKVRTSQSGFSPKVNNKQGNTRKFIVGEWNIQTLLDKPDDTERSERRTANIASELGRYKINIAALSETRFSDSGSIKIEGGGYVFYWSEKPRDERRDHCVGFAIDPRLDSQLLEKPIAINKRLMSLRIPLSKKRHVTLISAYALTMCHPEDNTDRFYQELQETINTCHTDKLIILSDFNARVGSDNGSGPEALGDHGLGKCNRNGEKLLTFFTENSLIITNTLLKNFWTFGKQPGCTRDLNTGTRLISSSRDKRTKRTSSLLGL